jgi:hypothetical protein
MFCHGHCLVFA